jgi:hypothetical protein
VEVIRYFVSDAELAGVLVVGELAVFAGELSEAGFPLSLPPLPFSLLLFSLPLCGPAPLPPLLEPFA